MSWDCWKRIRNNNHGKSKGENTSAQRAIDCKDLSTLQKPEIDKRSLEWKLCHDDRIATNRQAGIMYRDEMTAKD